MKRQSPRYYSHKYIQKEQHPSKETTLINEWNLGARLPMMCYLTLWRQWYEIDSAVVTSVNNNNAIGYWLVSWHDNRVNPTNYDAETWYGHVTVCHLFRIGFHWWGSASAAAADTRAQHMHTIQSEVTPPTNHTGIYSCTLHTDDWCHTGYNYRTSLVY